MCKVFIDLFGILEAMESKNVYKTSTNSGGYADCIRAVRREIKDDFWKSTIIDTIPYGLPDDIYDAIIEVVTDSTDDFWTCQNVRKILKKYNK